MYTLRSDSSHDVVITTAGTGGMHTQIHWGKKVLPANACSESESDGTLNHIDVLQKQGFRITR